MRISCLRLCCAAIFLLLTCLQMTSFAYDFSSLTALAEGALVGENVGQAVPGFEIRLTQDGEAIYHQAFGDWSLDRLARIDSSTKTLSGALMMSLAETGEGGFSLDSRLSDFLTEYDTPALRDITARQAFSHTSGFEGTSFSPFILGNSNITLQQAAQRISLKPLVNGPPGSTFAYGGLSMQAAGAAVEVATGERYHDLDSHGVQVLDGAAVEVATGERYVDLFADRITTPLEMTDTHFVVASQDNPRVAGGVESTATDFARFMDMLLNEGVDRATDTRVLEAASAAEMLTRQTDDAQPIANSPTDNSRYGIGVWLDQLDPVGPEGDVLAAGARGFHSWIDSSQGLVFTFATDLTSSSNVEFLSSKMHAAILLTLAPGDFNFDGEVNGEDFLHWQRSGSPAPLSLEDLAVWEANYGSPAPTPSLTVPEPTAVLLILGAGMAAICAHLGVSRRR